MSAKAELNGRPDSPDRSSSASAEHVVVRHRLNLLTRAAILAATRLFPAPLQSASSQGPSHRTGDVPAFFGPRITREWRQLRVIRDPVSVRAFPPCRSGAS